MNDFKSKRHMDRMFKDAADRGNAKLRSMKPRIRFYNTGLPCGNPGNIRKYWSVYNPDLKR